MSNVDHTFAGLRVAQMGRSLHSSGSGGGMDPMEKRVKDLEEQMRDVRTDIRVIKETMVTKADLHLELREQTDRFHSVVRDQTKTFVTWMLAIASVIVVAAAGMSWVGKAIMSATPH